LLVLRLASVNSFSTVVTAFHGRRLVDRRLPSVFPVSAR
jgi:hypothetical protein